MITGKTKTAKLPRYRTLFLSDLHLGSPHSQAERLLRFLQNVECDTLCLVGDIFDDPRLKLPPSHALVMSDFLERYRAGTRVIFIPGNHDAALRGLCGIYGGLTIVNRHDYTTVDGKTIIMTHGDELDWFGSRPWLHRIDRWLPLPFWEIVRKYLRGFMQKHIKKFEQRAQCAFSGDKVMVGHVHSPALKDNYINCGDWVTHCSAIVEHFDGTLELVYG